MKMLGKTDEKYLHICARCDHHRSRFRKTTKQSRRRARAAEKQQWKNNAHEAE